jgi:hypothetical protein
MWIEKDWADCRRENVEPSPMQLFLRLHTLPTRHPAVSWPSSQPGATWDSIEQVAYGWGHLFWHEEAHKYIQQRRQWIAVMELRLGLPFSYRENRETGEWVPREAC